MKNKTINVLMTTVLLASQVGSGLTVLAAGESDNKETIASISEKNGQDIMMGSNLDEDLFNEVSTAEPKELEMTPRGSSMTVSSPNLWLPLGTKDSTAGNAFFEQAEIRIDGRLAQKSEVDCDVMLFLENNGTDNIKQFHAPVGTYDARVKDKSNYANTQGVSSIVTVNYGSSIVFKNGISNVGTFTHNGKDAQGFSNNIMVSANNGEGSRSDRINTDYSGKNYFKVEVFEDSQLTKLRTSVTAKGDETKDSVLRRWNGNDIQKGDYIRTWCAIPENNQLYTADERDLKTNSYADKTDGYAYYKVGENRFEPVTKTSLEVVERTITTATKDDELDRDVEKSFKNIPSTVNVIGFTEYPSRDKEGKSYGKIKVSETSPFTGNKPVETIYTAPFKVEAVPLEVELNELDLFLGEDVSDVDCSKIVKSVHYQGEELDSEEYTVEFEEIPDTSVVGTDEEGSLKISLKEDSSVSAIEPIITKVRWGSTLVSKDLDDSSKYTMTSISLLTNHNKPKLTMTYGDSVKNERFRTRTEVKVYRENDSSELLSMKNDGYIYKSELIRKWQPEFDKTDLVYGDVLKETVLDYRDISFNGKATFISKDEELETETEGYTSAYYELTDQGYHLLRLNQLKIKDDVLTFQAGDSEEEIQKQAARVIEFPSHISEEDKKNFRFELTDIDTSSAGRKKGKVNIYENLASGGEFMMTQEVSYVVNEAPVKVELQSKTFDVGTHMSYISADQYVKAVYVGDKKIDKSEYTASFVKEPNTNIVGEQETEIKVEVKNAKKTVTDKSKTIIKWGNSIVSLAADPNKVDSSVSMLNAGGKPVLSANEGMGLSNQSNLYSRTTMNFYRGTDEKAKYTATNGTVLQKPSDLMNKWQKEFETYDLAYGDVLDYTVFQYGNAKTNENGKNTWVSRDNKLVKESEGYDKAYYELTKDGFRLMELNRLEVNEKLLSFNQGTTLAEMNKRAKEALVIPDHISDKGKFTFEFAEADTSTSGTKKTKMNVYENLVTGNQKFMTTYDVQYIVNPQVIEKSFDDKGKTLKKDIVTNFEHGTTYQGQPEKSMTISGDAYLYQGWLAGDKNPGKDKPTPGNPPVAKDTTTYQYVYKKADNMINMTIPTELLFETDKEDKQVSSKNYEIKNNSTDVSTEVILEEFVKETGDVKLLTSKDNNPTKETKAARLNVMENNKVVINSLTEATTNQSIKTLKAGETTTIGLTGTYFGSMEESNHVNYHMNFKFKAGAN